MDSSVARAHQHDEPADHALGRSRGNLTTKLHLACEQGQKPLSLVLTARQRGDIPQFVTVLDAAPVPVPVPSNPLGLIATLRFSPLGAALTRGRVHAVTSQC